MLGLPDEISACLFDLDGVLTDTASVHTQAWTQMFDSYLQERAARTGEPMVAFDPDGDYQEYVDGMPRQDGVRSFLASRGIQLPEGEPDDGPAAETVAGLGNRKNELFQRKVKADGVVVFEGSRRYLEAVTRAGMAVAVVSSSANTRDVLAVTGLARYVRQVVDGNTIRQEHLSGKPSPDSFRYAATLLNVKPTQAVVFEDALAGVAAGRDGHFGFVVGVNRVGHADALREHGADIVVDDLAELLVSSK